MAQAKRGPQLAHSSGGISAKPQPLSLIHSLLPSLSQVKHLQDPAQDKGTGKCSKIPEEEEDEEQEEEKGEEENGDKKWLQTARRQ